MTETERDTRPAMSLRAWGSTQDRLKEAAADDDERRGFTTLAGDLLEAALDFTRCNRCHQAVPVRYGNLAGRSFREWADEARRLATAQKCHEGKGLDRTPAHTPVFVGAGHLKA